MASESTTRRGPGASLPIVGGSDDNSTNYLNRELSWLAFNARVLALAEDPSRPLLERCKFVAIFNSNLDEFFQVRVAGLTDQQAAGLITTSPDGRTPGAQLAAVREVVEELIVEHQRIVSEHIAPELAAGGIELLRWSETTSADQAAMREYFEARVFPVLTPLAVDPGHPFPYISDLSLNLAVVLEEIETGRRLFARVKVPPLQRFVDLGDGRYVMLGDVIAANLEVLFPGMKIIDHHLFRVTRNSDLSLEEEEAEDLLEAVEMELRRRRFGIAVRLEVSDTVSDEVLSLLMRELDLSEAEVYRYRAPIDLTSLWELTELDRPDLLHKPFSPVTADALADEEGPVDFFSALRQGDVFLHHPYTSFATSVVEFLRQASMDRDVIAIKMTLYRTAGSSPIIDSLIAAAEAGKQVAVLVELKARFDEAANIGWARRLEQAGVHVTYGLVGLKIHAKLCMVVRDESSGMRRYCHIGTGNYHHRTANLYEDAGLLTADESVGDEIAQFFNSLTGYGKGIEYEGLLVGPGSLRDSLEDLIAAEAELAENGRVVMKMNSLVDPEMIDRLYDASQKGVRIDLIVRGICCLRPGVEGLSENISVRSLVGRYLEHSRIFYFANGAGLGQAAYYLGSADLMNRNLSRRVEAAVRIVDDEVALRIAELLEVSLSDRYIAWELDADGTWALIRERGGVDGQVRLQQLAMSRTSDRADAATIERWRWSGR
jgi:polyphosphate kinase